MRQVADPNVTIDHYPETCGTCGLALTAAMATRCSARQVFDLPEPQPLIVTEHRAYRCRCGRCGGETRAPFPEGVTAPVQYGPRLLAVVVYLLHYQLLPEDRLAEAMADLFGVQAGGGDPCPDEPELRGALLRGSPTAVGGAGQGRGGQAPGRDRLPDRRPGRNGCTSRAPCG